MKERAEGVGNERRRHLLIKNVKKRIVLLILYWIISEAMIWMIFEIGHGRYGFRVKSDIIPLSVLFSWGGLFFSGLTIHVCFFAYLICLYFLNSLIAKYIRSSIPVFPVCIHAIGSILIFFRFPFPDDLITPHRLFWVLCFIVCLPIALFFLSNDWWLAGSGQPTFIQVVKRIFRKRLRPIAVTIAIVVSLLGGYELMRIHAREKKMMNIHEGMKRSDVIKLLGKPRYIIKDKKGMFTKEFVEGKPEIAKIYDRQLVEMVFDLSLFNSSGAAVFFDAQTDEVLLVLEHRVYWPLLPFPVK